jgi:hypothetical protein
MKCERLLLTVTALATLLAVPRLARAQTAAAAPAAAPAAPDWDDRTMNGHAFIFPILQEGAFNTTHFGIRQGFAFAEYPSVPLGKLGSPSLSLSGLVEDFDLGVRILPWLGVYGNAEGQVALGASIDSLLLAGGQFGFSGQGGLVGRILRIESTGTQLSVRAFGGAGTGRNANIVGLVDALLGGSGKTGFSDVLNGNAGKFLLTPTGSNTFGGSFHAAQAFGKYVGAQAALEVDSARQSVSPFVPSAGGNVSQTTSDTAFKATVGVDVDGSPSGVPLGAMAEYEMEFDDYSAGGVSSSVVTNIVGVGLYYTARRNLILGLGGKTLLNPQPLTTENSSEKPVQSGSPSIYYGQFILRYVW